MSPFIFQDADLLAVSKYITNGMDLQDVGVQLGLGLHQIDSIRTNNPDNINQAACEVLRIWRDNCQELDLHEMKCKLKEVFKKVRIPIETGVL